MPGSPPAVDPPIGDRIGPLDVAGADVYIETNDSDFADELRWAMTDLATAPRPAADQVVYRTTRRTVPWVLWSTLRDGQPCELTMNERYVLFHQQWELNRLMIERTPNALHAAAAVVDGGAVVACGASMAGKTTLAGWLASHGGKYFSDEVVGVLPGGMVSGFRRPLGIRHHGPLGAQLTDAPRLTSRFHDYEMLVPPSSLGATIATETSVPVRALVMPTVDLNEPSRATPLGQAEALVALADGAPGLADHGEQMFELLVELVGKVPCVRLSMNDMDQAMTVLGESIGWSP